MTQSAIIFRTHYFDADIRDLLMRLKLETDLDVAVVVDETNGMIEIPKEFIKLSLNQKVLEDLHLTIPASVGWRCGDYNLYIAAKRFPDVSYFWMLEHDIFVNCNNLSEFFSYFVSRTDNDLLALRYAPGRTDWYWYPFISKFASPVFACNFGIVRISRRALEFLLKQRQVVSKTLLSTGEVDMTPNDESFVATLLTLNGYDCSDLNSPEHQVYEFGRTFTFNRPYSRRLLSASPPDGMLYHPVVDGKELVSRLQRLIESVQSMDKANECDAVIEEMRSVVDNGTLRFLKEKLQETITVRNLRDVARFDGAVEALARDVLSGWASLEIGAELQQPRLIARFKTIGNFQPTEIRKLSDGRTRFVFNLPNALSSLPWKTFLEEFDHVVAYYNMGSTIQEFRVPLHKSILFPYVA